MRLSKIGVEILPHHTFTGMFTVEVNVSTEGEKYTYHQVVGESDFETIFERMMDKAKRVILEKLKEKHLEDW